RAIDEDAVWVPENGGFKRIDSALIDKVTAEGDYVRIHSNGDSWMLHETMKSVSRRLRSSHFIRIHPSSIVRFQFIDLVVRDCQLNVRRGHVALRCKPLFNRQITFHNETKPVSICNSLDANGPFRFRHRTDETPTRHLANLPAPIELPAVLLLHMLQQLK